MKIRFKKMWSTEQMTIFDAVAESFGLVADSSGYYDCSSQSEYNKIKNADGDYDKHLDNEREQRKSNSKWYKEHQYESSDFHACHRPPRLDFKNDRWA